MFCVKCGAPIADDSAFCVACGASQALQQPAQPRYQQPAQPDPCRQPQQGYAQPQYQQPQYQQPYQQPQYQQGYQQPYAQPGAWQQPYAQPQYQQPVYQYPPQPTPAPGVGSIPGMPIQPIASAAVKTGMSVGMKALIGLLIAALIGFAAWFIMEQLESPEDKIMRTVEKLETSFNNLDTDGMLECFDPSMTAMYDAAMSLTGGLMGEMMGVGDMTDILTGMADLGQLLPDEVYDQIGGKPRLDITVTNIAFTSDTSANVTMTFAVSQGSQSETMTETLPMTELDGEWVISVMGLLGSAFTMG